MTLDEQLRAALPSLGLPDERCGPNRGSQLNVADRELYRWILRSFAAGQIPSIDDVALAAGEGGVDDVEHALGAMVEHDLIQRTNSGDIGCAYPFSTNPTNHVVTLDNGLRLYAMCAVDALGIPSMLRTGALITTTDPITGARIAITVDSDGAARSEPTAAVVLCAVAAGPGPLSALCLSTREHVRVGGDRQRISGSAPGVAGSYSHHSRRCGLRRYGVWGRPRLSSAASVGEPCCS